VRQVLPREDYCYQLYRIVHSRVLELHESEEEQQIGGGTEDARGGRTVERIRDKPELVLVIVHFDVLLIAILYPKGPQPSGPGARRAHES
jgi:hypothetical protein